MVSSDFGKLDVQRHLSSGIDCAIAGFATAAAATPTPAARRNSRRFIGYTPFGGAAGPPQNQDRPHHTEGLGEIQPGALRQRRCPDASGADAPLADDPTSGAGAHPDHEAVVAVFGDLPPQVFLV